MAATMSSFENRFDNGMVDFCLVVTNSADSSPPQKAIVYQTCLVASTIHVKCVPIRERGGKRVTGASDCGRAYGRRYTAGLCGID